MSKMMKSETRWGCRERERERERERATLYSTWKLFIQPSVLNNLIVNVISIESVKSMCIICAC